MDVLNRARSSKEHQTSDEVQACRRYAGRKPEGYRRSTTYTRVSCPSQPFLAPRLAGFPMDHCKESVWPPLSLNVSRVLTLACLLVLTEIDVKFRCGCCRATETNAEDWRVAGPRTLSWCARLLSQRPGGPLDWHRFWRSTLKSGK